MASKDTIQQCLENTQKEDIYPKFEGIINSYLDEISIQKIISDYTKCTDIHLVSFILSDEIEIIINRILLENKNNYNPFENNQEVISFFSYDNVKEYENRDNLFKHIQNYITDINTKMNIERYKMEVKYNLIDNEGHVINIFIKIDL